MYEMTAVRYMLDREHDAPELPANDDNVYIFGELWGHNVVVACLPGTQGKASAAIVASKLDSTFESIKLRFMVGIGGGVPSARHDIRLGDVVVSMPEGTHGGVIQYDLGKDTGEDEFQLKGSLLPPPMRLRSAVVRMQSDHYAADNKTQEFLSQMLQRSQGLSIYDRSSCGQDILFKPDYSHVSGEATCEKCDKSGAVHRRARSSSNPKIHYGLIASGDRVIKNATRRDRYAKAVGDILCFEMEAAGIATEYSCIVIRGVSDYADSHKNDTWHHYAAATAAACFKEILFYVKRDKLPGESQAIPASQPSQLTSLQPSRQSTFTAPGIQQFDSGNKFSLGEDLHVGQSHPSIAYHDVSLQLATAHKDRDPASQSCTLISSSVPIMDHQLMILIYIAHCIIPFPRNESVIDRSIFSQLETLLPESPGYQTAALCGMGGSG
jgi:nucleoside phosphorylase